MRIAHNKLGIPIRKYYFEQKQALDWADFLLPTAYMDCYSGNKPPFFNTEYRHTLLTDLTRPEETIFAEFSKDNRNQIRRCEREKRFTLQRDTPLEQFIPLYNAFASQKGLSLFIPGEAERIGSHNYRIFSVQHGDEVLICHFYLLSPAAGVSNLLISASSLEYRHDPDLNRAMGHANRCLHWQGIKYFKAAGFHTYDWGGYAPDTDNPALRGINRFKRSFNGRQAPIYNHYSPAYAVIEHARQKLREWRG